MTYNYKMCKILYTYFNTEKRILGDEIPIKMGEKIVFIKVQTTYAVTKNIDL